MRNTLKLFDHEFIIPLNDRECHRVIKDQYNDVDRAIDYCKEKNTVVQAGGNMGIWPYYLAGIFKTVHTFEPHPENFYCLDKNCPQENIAKYQKGLSNVAGKVGFVGDERNCGAYQLDGNGDLDIITLDEIELDSLDLLILDIEGMELKALQGAVNHISKFKPVIMLEDKGLSKRYGTEKGDVTLWLQELGYNAVEQIHRDIIYVV